MKLGVRIKRSACVTTYHFKDYFKGFENVKIVRRIFGRKTNEVLHNLKIEFIGWGGYMLVSDIDGHLIISADYLRKGDVIDIYLDVIHELVHVKQFMKGKKLFDERFNYTDRPTEIEAYRYAVSEARRLGLDEERICQYLKTEWMSMKDFKRLTKALNVKFIQEKS
jgi:hypothetical protein